MAAFSYRFLTIWGIPVKIHLSLIVLLVLVALLAGLTSGLVGIAWNLLLVVLVFASILLHELAHSLVALAKGARVRQITLLFIGGAAQMESIPSRPADELLLAAAGPAFSLALAAALGLAGAHVPLAPIFPAPWTHRPVNIVTFVAAMNVGLAAFNLLPAFPMDGGRIFRALMSPRIGRLAATFVASRLGRLLAIAMGIVGWIHARDGWWALLPIAFFIFRAAGMEYRMVAQEDLLRRAAAAGPAWGGFRDTSGGAVIVGPPPYGAAGDTSVPLREQRR